VGAEQVVELALPLRRHTAVEVGRADLRAKECLGDKARLLRCGTLGLRHREAPDDDEDQRSGQGERHGKDDREAQDEARRAFDGEQPERSRAATCELHQRFGFPVIGLRRSSTSCVTVFTGSSIT
jgi:hypothetical protein